jgi:hypothetical protein
MAPASNPQRPFTDDEFLYRYSDVHVCYEVDRFLWVATLLDKGALIGGSSPERVNDLLVEGFVLHFRNVIDFLYPRDSIKADDVIAADFVVAGNWDTIRPPLSAFLREARKRADKEMMHLTTARIFGAPPEKRWNTMPIANELKPILKLLCDNAVSTKLSPRVAQLIA